MPIQHPRPLPKRFLQANWLHRWLNAPATRAAATLPYSEHPAMLRHASVQRHRQLLPLQGAVSAPGLAARHTALLYHDINVDA